LLIVSDGCEKRTPAETYVGFTHADAQRFADYLDAEGEFLCDYASYVIRAGGTTVLIDTGWGDRVVYQGRAHGGPLLDELAEMGVRPEDIDIVTFSHLHVDHVGWNVTEDRQGGARPTFPRARYLVPKADWDYFGGGKGREQNSPSLSDDSFRRCVRPLEDMGVLDMLSGDSAIGPALNAISTPGHTPGHTSFLVRSDGDQAFILGDVCVRVLDAEHPELRVIYDEHHELNQVTRRTVLDRVEREELLVAACHFPHPGLGHFRQVDGRRRWVPVSDLRDGNPLTP
jgi:glyoxylase-like metal-dependent hydrolase (beta-lactamase superfamily II)